MSDYAIGDVQGCYEPLMRLLDSIKFCDKQDRLWFVGDLVNRGPQSLEVLRFVKNLQMTPFVTLGNHDLHLLVKIFTDKGRSNSDDTLEPILKADDCEELGHWLRQQAILVHDEPLNVVMCHAGIAPMWTLAQAKQYASELELVLRSERFVDFLNQMYGNKPSYWQDQLQGMERWRTITNYFTRMRFCDLQGQLIFDYKGTIEKAPAGLVPWYEVPNRPTFNADLVFGHWAALQGNCPVPNFYAIDTGCLWGGALTALRLQDRQRFSVSGLKNKLSFS